MAEPTKEQIKAQNRKSKQKRQTFVESGKWANYIRENYPALVSIYESNPEVAAIIRDGYVKGAPSDKINQQVLQSTWYKNLGSGEYEYIVGTTTKDKGYADKIASRQSEVKNLAQSKYGSYQFDDATLNQVAVDSLKFGYTQTQIDEQLGKAASRGKVSAPVAPGAMAPTAAVQTSTTAATLRDRAKAYGIDLTDGIIQGYVDAVNNKTMTDEQVTNLFRQQAKSLYPSVSGQLDGGTLNDVTSSYRALAANTLGIDSDMVDFTNSKFKPLLTYKDPETKESRMMNSTEWTSYLRNLPEWQKTKEASDTYSKLYNSLTQLFGKAR